jgi:hypothetical protein
MEKKRYWKLKEKDLDRTVWRTCFGRGYGPVLKQTTKFVICGLLGNYTASCNYPKDHRLHQHRGGSLKSRKDYKINEVLTGWFL